MKLDMRYGHHPEDVKHYDTDTLRRHFLVEKIFVTGELTLTYTHVDRVVFGGAPIFDHTGFVVATLSVSWPGFRYERGDEADKIEKVKAAAGRISTILGYEP